MAVKYAGGGGWGIWDILGTIASVAIPGAAPFVAGAKALGGLLNGDPGQAAMQAVGMVAPGKVTKSEGITPSAGGGVGVATPEMSLAPDATDRMQMNKELRAQQVADASKYAQLVSMYGNSPENDWTARQEAIRGGYESIPGGEQTQWENLLTRYPTLFRRR